MSGEHRIRDSPGDVLSALGDKDCWAILTETVEEPRTVSELCSACDIPMATAYRKVNRLTDLSLLNERIRVKPRGRNSCEYSLCAETIRISVPMDASTLTVDCTIRSQQHARTPAPVLSTDGGHERDTHCANERQDQYRALPPLLTARSPSDDSVTDTDDERRTE